MAACAQDSTARIGTISGPSVQTLRFFSASPNGSIAAY